VSGPLPGAVRDLTAARLGGIVRELAAAGLIVLADKGYHGAGDHIRTPCKGRNKPESQKAANRAHAKLRGPGERVNAQLKPGASCANSAAAPGRPGNWPKPSTSFKSARPKERKKRSFNAGPGIAHRIGHLVSVAILCCDALAVGA
jgi:hypothetical protein